MSTRTATRRMAREEVREARAKVVQPAIDPAPEAKPREPSPFAKWWADRQANKPDWSYEGFEAACHKWLDFASKKDFHLMPELSEFLAHQIANELNQRKVDCLWIATDKTTGRPYVKIVMADRWVFYHDVAVTIPRMS